MTQVIELQSVTRRFRNDKALEDVTLTVPDGAICGLLGRNGAGKTTVMSLISGVWFSGRKPRRPGTSRYA